MLIIFAHLVLNLILKSPLGKDARLRNQVELPDRGKCPFWI
jgi:hypothetical protein